MAEEIIINGSSTIMALPGYNYTIRYSMHWTWLSVIVRVRPGPVLGACARWLPRPVFGLVMAAVPGCAVLCATLWRFVSCVLVLCVGPGPSLCL